MLNPIIVQRIEGAFWLLVGIAGFSATSESWWWLAGFLLVPDISMIGYVAGPRIGGIGYNLGHSVIAPAALISCWFFDGPSWTLVVGSIWLAHIGMDRLFGYGFKLAQGFEHTHLGPIGRLKKIGQP